jgi:hypothetical protein
VSEAGIAVLNIPASGHVRQRAPEERKRIREWLYRRFLGDLSLRIIPRTWVELKAVGFQGLGPEELYSQVERRLGETVGESANMLRKRGGLVCYLYDSHNTYTSLALFCGVDRERDAVKVLCQTCQGVKRILVGRVFLTADGEEQFTLD